MKKCALIVFVVLYSISAQSQCSIDTTQVVVVGGIKQFVTLKGADRSKPLLLFLHGGPGNSMRSYAESFTRRLEEYFVVVHWDQRQSGQTLQLNSSPMPLNVEMFKDDTHEIITLLLAQFHQPKLYLLGHSWGTMLGFHIARNFPQLLYAYIPVCSMINQRESEQIILNLMKENAKKHNNVAALKELSTVHIPFENGAELYFHRKWLFQYIGSNPKISKNYVENWSRTWLAVFNEASNDNLIETAPAIDCPVYFFAGRKDYQTNSSIAEQYFHILKAPKKDFFWFERSAHSVPSTEPTLFQSIIIDKILPATLN